MTTALVKQVMALPAKEKLDLIDKIWESMSSETDDLEVSDEEKRILDERWGKYLANPESALTTEQFDVLLQKRRRK